MQMDLLGLEASQEEMSQMVSIWLSRAANTEKCIHSMLLCAVHVIIFAPR